MTTNETNAIDYGALAQEVTSAMAPNAVLDRIEAEHGLDVTLRVMVRLSTLLATEDRAVIAAVLAKGTDQ